MKNIFKNELTFAMLEEQAIDGQLNYDDYPPEEYKYFSRLARLGYLNRHSGWTKELCEQKQEELKKDYKQACERRDERLNHAILVQARRLRTPALSLRLNKARTPGGALDAALELVELLTEEPGLKARITDNLKGEIK